MIRNIIKIDIDDNAKIEFVNISKIREVDEYGGFRITLNVKIDTIRENFQLDVATGDPITPCPYEYEYMPILGDSYIKVWTYNIETMIAEKLETILKRVEANGRTRDYYDLYLIYIKGWDKVNIHDLRNAINKTFSKRKYKGDIFETINILRNSSILRKRWELYSKKYEYAKGITYDEVVACIEEIISVLDFTLV